MNQIDLKGRCAVVVGGAGGIGSAIVRRLAESGARVAVWDLRLGQEEQAGALQVQVDVTDEASVTAAQARTMEAFGRIDILVTAAGATGPTRPTASYEWKDWTRVIDLNLNGTFLCCRAVLPGMLEKDYGRIVNISSIAGKEGNANLAAYSAAKAGVIALTKVLGRETAETGVRVNAVAPGLVRTAILDEMTEEAVRWSLERIPMKRAGTVEEVAGMVAWLASEECSFSTGAVFDISGGRAGY